MDENPNICAFPSTCGDDGDDDETASEGPKPTSTSNCIASNTWTSPGCARAYESDKYGEGGAVCRDVYFVVELGAVGIVVIVIVEEMIVAWVGVPASIVGDVNSVGPAFIVGVEEGCKKVDTGVGIESTAVSVRVVVVIIDERPARCNPNFRSFTLLDPSLPLDAERGNIL